MAGHNKWSKVKRTKGVKDVKKSKQYTKILREIAVAVKESGPDIPHNARLRVAIQNAKSLNMPKENIERAIKKSSGSAAESYVTMHYEAYGPYGVALWIVATTDNLNRTLSYVRSTLHKYEGSLAKNGTLKYIFLPQWKITIPQDQIEEKETFMMQMIDQNVDNIEETSSGTYILYCNTQQFTCLQNTLEAMHITWESAHLVRIPQHIKNLSKDHMEKIDHIIAILEDNDNVQAIYHNAKLN